jgi:hypothetical protein
MYFWSIHPLLSPLQFPSHKQCLIHKFILSLVSLRSCRFYTYVIIFPLSLYEYSNSSTLSWSYVVLSPTCSKNPSICASRSNKCPNLRGFSECVREWRGGWVNSNEFWIERGKLRDLGTLPKGLSILDSTPWLTPLCTWGPWGDHMVHGTLAQGSYSHLVTTHTQSGGGGWGLCQVWA